ncbi:MAG: acyl-CoA synthetase [Acidimicrobiales bacterium]
MYPGVWAQSKPHHPAVIMAGSGEQLSYGELDARSNQLAHHLRSVGLVRGDHIALFMENQIRYMEVAWAALRSGIYVTAINSFLSAPEVGYIVNDCEAKVFVTSRARAEVATAVMANGPERVKSWLMVDGTADEFQSYEEIVGAHPSTKIDDESTGSIMLYSSGTTGQPKGVLRALPEIAVDEGDPRGAALFSTYSYGPDMVYLSPAPMYHAAPLVFSLYVHRAGGTLVIMEKFDAAAALRYIEQYKVTHSQWVPTMFVRMLKLGDDRPDVDLSSHRVAIHAAAPCPVEVKRQMIDWWGPILYEYYAGTEGVGSTLILSEEWLTKPGSVGRVSQGTIHIVDPLGNDLPPNEIGAVYFGGNAEFVYHNAPEKTAESRLAGGRATLGDVGYVDDDGYLFLTDRKAFMIISGGVNIYPQEIEDCLVLHPSVADVAVFGIPDDEMGEAVKAAVQLADGVPATPDTERELLAFVRAEIAHYKVPRSIDFHDELPRLPTGKLYKRYLRDAYWKKAEN